MKNLTLLILITLFNGILCATAKPSDEASLEATVNSMSQKITTLESKLRSLESREMPYLVQKVKDELTARLEEVRTESETRHDELSAKLEELLQKTLAQSEDTGLRSSRVGSETEIGKDNLSTELQKIRKKSDEVLQKVQRVEYEVERGRSKMETLEMEENLTRSLIASHIASRGDVDEGIRQNLTTSVRNLRQHVDERLLGLENGQSVIKRKMSNLATLISNVEREVANTNVSRLDASLENLDKITKAGLRSIWNKVEQLEKRADQRDADTSEMKKTLLNHTSEIDEMNAQLFDIQNGCSDPPPIGEGYPVNDPRHLGRMHGAVVSYACDPGRTLVESGDLMCRRGQWTGVLPQCLKNCRTEDLKDYDGLDISRNTTVEHSKTLDVRCRRGYVISPTSTPLTCNNGTWHVTADPCITDSCAGQPPSLTNGKATDFERKHGSNVRYECDRHFVMTRNSTVRCESGKWEGHPPTCSYFDVTFYAEASYNPWYIECYSEANADKIGFSRVLDIGSGGDLPTNATQRRTDKSSRMDLGGAQYHDWTGAYRCGFAAEGRSAEIVVPYQIYGYLYFRDRSAVANPRDKVSLRLISTGTGRVRWSRNGIRVPFWDGKLEVGMKARLDDAGIYHARYEEDAVDTAIQRLNLRRCKASLYGDRCDQVCPPCYNGGICHHLLGLCVCPDGFVGRNCETPCPEGFHGHDCSTPCAGGDCYGRFYCKPDPHGCSCARGFKGSWCYDNCDAGWYGADCKQPCHCARGPHSCNRFTGACSGGCAHGWKGQSCQIRDD